MTRPAPRPLAALVLSALLGAAALAGCSKPTGSEEKFCDQVRKVPALESVLARFSEIDVDVLQERIDKARAAYEELAVAAPSAIDVQTDEVVGLVDAILDAVEENPTDPAKASEQLRTAMADHDGIGDARAEVASYAEEECGVQLDATLTDTTETTGTTAGTSTTGVAGVDGGRGDPAGSTTTTVG